MLKMKISNLLLIALLGVCAIALGLALGYVSSAQTDRSAQSAETEHDNSVTQTTAINREQSSSDALKRQTANMSESNVTLDNLEPDETHYLFDQAAIDSMADARINGDDRAPPIGKSVEPQQPTAQELESPELYLEYESRHEKKIYKAYIDAADTKIEMLEAQIALAKEQGLSKEEIAVGVEKVTRIRSMREQLLVENPELKE